MKIYYSSRGGENRGKAGVKLACKTVMREIFIMSFTILGKLLKISVSSTLHDDRGLFWGW